MMTVELRDYRDVCRRLRRITMRLVLAQTALAIMIFFLCVSRPLRVLAFLSIEPPRLRQELGESILIGALIWSMGYLWLVVPCRLLLGGIRVYCPRCDHSLSARCDKRVFDCPACEERFDDGTIARLAEESTGPPRGGPPADTEPRS
jgi:hypothetical protein